MVIPSQFDKINASNGIAAGRFQSPRVTPPPANLDQFDLFVQSETFSEAIERYEELSNGCRESNIDILYELRKHTKNWKGVQLLDKLIKKSENAVYFPSRRAAHAIKKGHRVAHKQKCLIIGAGPCGLRTAIEMAFMGASVTVIDSRKEFSRNNVLHLWPFCISDLKSLGAKSFYGKFCSGAIDHCSIRRLQLLLAKVCLLLGVSIHREIFFENVLPDHAGEWRVLTRPVGDDRLDDRKKWNCVVDASGGSANTASKLSPDLSRKEFRGLLAIGITVNFVNQKTQAEANVEEISGVASIYKQHFFAQLRNATGIDLENIVYYKDDTHYFVMTARTKSLLNLGVLRNNLDDPGRLLDRSNIDPIKLQEYATNAANFATQYKLPDLTFALNSRGNPDVSIFDFTSRYHSKYAAVVRKTKKTKILGLLVGDSLINPFWPTGTGIGKGFLGVFDACWAFRQLCLGEDTTRVLQERESIFKLLDQCDPTTLNKKVADYTIDPKTRYLNLSYFSNVPQNTSILFVEETKGKRRSLAPVQSEPNPKKRNPNRGNTLKDQEKIIITWLNAILKNSKLNKLSDIKWKEGKILLDIIESVRPDLIDKDTIEPNLGPLGRTELATTIAKTCFNIEPMGSPAEFIKSNPDHLLILTYLTQIKDNINLAPFASAVKPRKSPNHNSTIKKTSPDTKNFNFRKNQNVKSPKKSLEEKLSKLTETLKRKSQNHKKPDICPFCNEQVFVAERYGSDGFWFHRKCFKCFICKQLLVFSGDNYREIDNNYYCQSCAPQSVNQNSSLLAKIDEEMTEPQKQDIVDKIIENTNVPVKPKPMPRTKFIKPVKRSESLKVFPTSSSQSHNSSHQPMKPLSPISSNEHILSTGSSSQSPSNIFSDGGSSCDQSQPKSQPSSQPSPQPRLSQNSRNSEKSQKSSSRKSASKFEKVSVDEVDGPRKMTPTRTRTISQGSKTKSSVSTQESRRSVPLNDVKSQSGSSSMDSFEEETLSKWNQEEIGPSGIDQSETSLPKVNHLESIRSQRTSFVKRQSLSSDVREIDLTPQRPTRNNAMLRRRESKIHHARVVRPVTWYGHENNSPDEDDDVHEAEQFVRARQLKAQSVQRSLEEVAVRQIEIEKESVEIEKLIRLGRSNSNELMNKWFELVKEKNHLLRHENKLMIEQRELQLQDHQQSIAATIRERLKLPEEMKTAESKKEDEILERVKHKKFFIRHIERSIV